MKMSQLVSERRTDELLEFLKLLFAKKQKELVTIKDRSSKAVAEDDLANLNISCIVVKIIITICTLL